MLNINSKAKESRNFSIFVFLIAVLLCTVLSACASNTAAALYPYPVSQTTTIDDSVVPLSAQATLSTASTKKDNWFTATNQTRLNGKYRIDKSMRNGVPVPYVPEFYKDAPWDATFPRLDEDYAAAVAMGYEIYDEEKVLALFNGINDMRAQNGLPPLALVTSGNLYKLTYIRAVEIMNKYSHERPDGTTAVTSMSDFYIFAEILNGKMTIEKTLQSWHDSPEHFEAILLPDIQEMSAVGIEADFIETIGKQAVLFGNRNCDY